MKAQVITELPDGWELDCDTLRIPQVGEYYIRKDSLGNMIADKREVNLPFLIPCVIVRPAWQWPEWLTAEWLFQFDDGAWYGSECEPVLTITSWREFGKSLRLSESLLSFTPPPCTNWRQSKRRNPKHAT